MISKESFKSFKAILQFSLIAYAFYLVMDMYDHNYQCHVIIGHLSWHARELNIKDGETTEFILGYPTTRDGPSNENAKIEATKKSDIITYTILEGPEGIVGKYIQLEQSEIDDKVPVSYRGGTIDNQYLPAPWRT